MARRNFGIYDENFNDGLNRNQFMDESIGGSQDLLFDEINYGINGGGGGITRGGGGSTIIQGCTDPKAKNYNRNATRDNGSCIYNPPVLPVVGEKSRTVLLNIKVDGGKSSSVLVDGKEVTSKKKGVLEFTEKELLSPKTITVLGGDKSQAKETYRVSTTQKTNSKTIKPVIPKDFDNDQTLSDFQDRIKFSKDIGFRPNFPMGNIFGGSNPRNPLFNLGGFGNTKIPQIDYDRPTIRPTLGIAPFIPSTTFKKPALSFGSFEFKYYEVKIEKKDEDGEFRIIKLNISDSKPTLLKGTLPKKALSYDLFFTIEQRNPLPIVSSFDVSIIGNVSSNDIIFYQTSEGDEGYIKDGKLNLSYTKQGKRPTCYVKFSGVGISDYTHTVDYIFNSSSQPKKESRRGLETTINLSPGKNDIEVNAVKKSVVPSPTTPIIKVDNRNLVFNIANSKSVNISYGTEYADKVIYTLGKVVREIKPSGVISLTNSDFPNGVGRYILYLQPVSKRGGSGENQKVVVTVESRAYLPGPDITHINFPQNIKGADFKEYNVDFDISWQSINTNYIHIYVDKVTDKNFLAKVSPQGDASFNVADIVQKMGAGLVQDRDKSVFKLLFIPYNEEGDELTPGKTEQATITFDKGDLRLRRAGVVNDIKNAFISNADESGFEDFISPLLTHYLHIGDGDNKLIGTWGIDDKTFSEKYIDEETNETKYRNIEKSLVLKLYEPLPSDVNTNDKLWISKVHSIPLIDQITILDDVTKHCVPLTPNFGLDVGDDIGYQILDDLVASGSTSSTEVVGQFISSSEFSLENLDINYVDTTKIVSGSILVDTTYDYNWKDFVKYSSAQERVHNFYYKIKLINQYESRYDLLTSGSQWTGSVSVRNEAKLQQEKINDLKKGFDSFEKFLFTSSSADNLTYPKTDSTGSIINALSSSAISWYNGAVESARIFDDNNTSRFTYNLPQHIQNDDKGQEFVLFFDMIGQHYDIIWTHIKGFSQSKKLEHKYQDGITNDLVYHMLESLGWDADMGVQSQLLWEYAFGKHSDGSSVSEMSGKDRQNEVWRRILNNLPYLYKNKGTKRALHAAMSCYGVPASMLTIMEFGGPKDPTSTGTTKFTFEDRTASINISGSQSIDIPWKQYSGTSEHPNSVEIRLNTEHKQDQQIISGSDWSLNLLTDTGSHARVELVVGSQSSSTEPMPIYNDEYTQIVVNRTTGSSDVFDVYVKEGFQERIRNEVSASLTTSEKGWTSGSYISIGGSNIVSSVDEFRLWTTALSQSKIENHTLLPDAIDGNHVSSSTDDLIFRLDFEYPKNRHISGDVNVKNVSINRSYDESYATASNFDNISSYPYHYTPYDRTVTADVPSSGFNVGNKLRFETQTKISNLSYRQRATRKSYDQSPIDSDRLGLFFSPIKEINMDIIKSLGDFSIDNYIGNPQDEYSDEYSELRQLRNYYFDRYNLNLYEYIQLVRYIDKSLFETLESLVPARAKVSSGLLIEPHILERNKTKWNRPQGENKQYESIVDVEGDISLSSTNPQYTMSLDVENVVSLQSDNIQYESSIDAESDINLNSELKNYESLINADSDVSLLGEMTVNSGSTMGGIEFTINSKDLGASLVGQFDSTKFTSIGMEKDSISRLGFGLYGENGSAQRTFIDVNGNTKKERVKIYLLKQSYTEDIPQNIDSNDSSRGTEKVTQTKYRYRVNILPFTGSDGNETSSSVVGDIVEATPLDGYFPSHYRNVGDLTSGLENSFFNGSKQTASTTLDGSSPVQTFTTNPNTLKVSDSGRGSGEPILEVD